MQYTIGLNNIDLTETELVAAIAHTLKAHGYDFTIHRGAGLYVNGLPERHILFEKVNNANHVRR